MKKLQAELRKQEARSSGIGAPAGSPGVCLWLLGLYMGSRRILRGLGGFIKNIMRVGLGSALRGLVGNVL